MKLFVTFARIFIFKRRGISCIVKVISVSSFCSKNLEILIILISIHSKHNMEMTNINFVFHQILPREREREGKWQKKLLILKILMSIPTKHNMSITNITLVFHQIIQ